MAYQEQLPLNLPAGQFDGPLPLPSNLPATQAETQGPVQGPVAQPIQQTQGNVQDLLERARQQQGGTGMDRIAELLRMAGLDQGKGQAPSVSPREQRMQMLRDFMSGTLYSIGQGLQAYSKAPAGARNQAMFGASLSAGEERRRQLEEERIKRDTLATLEQQRRAQAVLDLTKAQNSTEQLPYQAIRDLTGAVARMATANLNAGARTDLLGAQGRQADAAANAQNANALKSNFIMDNDKGLIDLRNPQAGYIPGTGSQDMLDITTELANTLGLPQTLVGKSMTALDINRLSSAIASPYKVIADKDHVRMLNPATGQMYEFGAPASTAERQTQPSRQVFQMYEQNPITGKNEMMFVQPGTGQVTRMRDLQIDPSAITMTSVANPQLIAAAKEENAGAKAVRFLNIIDDLSSKLITKEGSEAVVEGAMQRGAAFFNHNADLISYDSAIEAFTPMWARNLGHTGVLTQQDVDSAKSIFPKIGESKTIKDQKMDIIKSIMGGNIQAARELLDKYGGTATGRVLNTIFYDKDVPGDGLGILGQFENGRLLTPGQQGQGQTRQPAYRGQAPQQVQPPARVTPPAPVAPGPAQPQGIRRAGRVVQQ